MSDILVHELAHVLEKTDSALVDGFLSLRRDSTDYDRLIRQFWGEIKKSNEPDSIDTNIHLTPEAIKLLRLMRLPQRTADDGHAARSHREYWAVCVEIAYRAWTRNNLSSLKTILDPREADYLIRRFAHDGISPHRNNLSVRALPPPTTGASWVGAML